MWIVEGWRIAAANTAANQRAGTDLVIVAELMGHHDLETTRLYTLPTDDDVAAAVGRLQADQ